MGLLDGKVAVITGAGSGMAKASVKVFVREGAKVVAADISGAEKDTAAEVGEGVAARPLRRHEGGRRRGDDRRPRSTSSAGSTRCCNVAGIADGVMLTDVTDGALRPRRWTSTCAACCSA